MNPRPNKNDMEAAGSLFPDLNDAPCTSAHSPRCLEGTGKDENKIKEIKTATSSRKDKYTRE